MIKTSDICAIVVTYHPDHKLYTLLQSLLAQAGMVLIIDNTESTANSLVTDVEQHLPQDNLKKIMLGYNAGVGAALNKGIAWAKQQGMPYVLLSDQDSCPANNMAAELLNAQQLLSADHKIAAVGPLCIDSRNGQTMPFIKFSGCQQNNSIFFATNKNYQVVDFLITSGSLIALRTFEQVGLFDESLFIDNVDIEWCLRAAKRGFACIGVNSATLQHHLGEKVVILFGRSVRNHQPLRLYYRFRNSLLLYKRNYVPFCWKLRDAGLLCLKTVFYSVLAPNRMQSIRMMLLGFWHGMQGVHGKYTVKR